MTSDLALFVSGAALFDSLSTGIQIVALILLFSTVKPIRASLAFLAGLGGAYFVCGLVGLGSLDQVNALARFFVPDANAVPDALYYPAELVAGIGFLVGAPLWEWYRVRTGRPTMDPRWLAVFKRMTPPVAAITGAVLSASSFLLALPYLAALEKIVAAHLDPLGSVTAVGLYNLMYLVPLLVPFVLFVVLREAVVPQLHLHAPRVNRWLTLALVVGMGLYAIADAIVFFQTGQPLLTNRFL